MAKVLLVDDDMDMIEIAKIHLENAGHSVAYANNRNKGMEAVRAETPDVIILDVMMESEDDGFVMAQDLRRDGIKTPIIMLTNVGRISGMKFDKDNEMVPVDEYLEKPVDPETLAAKIKNLLG